MTGTTGSFTAVTVNGQPTTYGTVNPAYIVVGLATSVGSFGLNQTIILDTVVGNVNSQVSYNSSTGVFTLTAGVTYDMSFTPSFISFTNLTGGFFCYDWVDATTNALLDASGIGTGTSIPVTETSGQIDNPTARIIYTPSTNQTVKLRCTNANGTATLRGGLGTQAIITPLNVSVAMQATATGTLNTDYIQVGRITSSQTVTNAATPQDIVFNSNIVTNSGIAYNTSTGVFTLTAGKTYEFESQITYSMADNNNYILFTWVDATTNGALDTSGASVGTVIPTTWGNQVGTPNSNYGGLSKLIYTPSTNQTVKLRITAGVGSGTITAGQGTYAKITQIANQFALTAISGLTTTGDVNVGGNLTVTGNIASTPAGFRATTPVTNVTVNNSSSATMLFGTEEVDTKNWYDPATGRFTPNVTGYYNVDWFIVTSSNGTGELLATLNKNGTDIAWGTNVVNATAHWNGVGGSSSMVYLNGTTDYLIVKLTNNSGSTVTVYSGSLCYFSAYLIR